MKADPRLGLVERGIAPNWEDLNGRWAVLVTGYGENIVRIWSLILGETVQPVNNTDITITISRNGIEAAANALKVIEGFIQWLESSN